MSCGISALEAGLLCNLKFAAGDYWAFKHALYTWVYATLDKTSSARKELRKLKATKGAGFVRKLHGGKAGSFEFCQTQVSALIAMRIYVRDVFGEHSLNLRDWLDMEMGGGVLPEWALFELDEPPEEVLARSNWSLGSRKNSLGVLFEEADVVTVQF